jgi:copper chaperone CopZ
MALVSAVAFPQEGKKRKEKVTFRVEGMDCNNCVRKIEKNIAFEKGVTDLRCDLSTRTAEVTYRTDKTTADRLVTAFRKIGMGATPVDGKNGANKPPAD